LELFPNLGIFKNKNKIAAARINTETVIFGQKLAKMAIVRYAKEFSFFKIASKTCKQL